MKDIWEEESDHNPLKLNEDKSIALEFNCIKIKKIMASEAYDIVYRILTESKIRRAKQCINE